MHSDPYVAAWTGNGPDDQAQYRQQDDQQYPQDLGPGRGTTLDDVDDRLDVQREDDQAKALTVASHRRIASAIAERLPQEARTAMRTVIEEGFDRAARRGSGRQPVQVAEV